MVGRKRKAEQNSNTQTSAHTDIMHQPFPGTAIRRSLACKTASMNWSSVWSTGLTGAESAVSRRRENYILFMVYSVMHYLMLRLFMV